MKVTSADVVCTTSEAGAAFTTDFYVRFYSSKAPVNAQALPSLVAALASTKGSIKLRRADGGQVAAVSGSDGDNSNPKDDDTISSASLDSVNSLVSSLIWFDVEVNKLPHPDILACVNRGIDQMVMFYDPWTNEFTENPSVSVGEWGIQKGYNMITLSASTSMLASIESQRQRTEQANFASIENQSVAADINGAGFCETSFGLFLYPLDAKLAVIDIDGTVTVSDVRGYVESVFLGVYTHVHHGVVHFLRVLEENFGYSLIFLTSRPLAHMTETRQLLASVRDSYVDGNGKKSVDHTLQISRSALFVNLKSISKAVYGEVIARTSADFKAGVLHAVNRMFTAAGRFGNQQKNNSSGSRGAAEVPVGGSVFFLGVGNKNTDMAAYSSAGVPVGRMLLVDTASNVKVWHPPAGSDSGDGDIEDLPEAKVTGRGAASRGVRGKGGSTSTIATTSNAASNQSTAAGTAIRVFSTYADPNLLFYLDEINAGLSNLRQAPTKVPPAVVAALEREGNGAGGSTPSSPRPQHSSTLSAPQGHSMNEIER
jgi:hypothetical protein